MVLYLWQGSDDYLQSEWAHNGHSPEISTFDALEEAAERYQEARQYEQYDAQQ